MFDRDGFDDRIWEVFGMRPEFDSETRMLIGEIAEIFADGDS